MIDASSGGALVNMTPTETMYLISTMAANSQQLCPTNYPPRRVHEITSSSLENDTTAQVNVVGNFPRPPQRAYNPFSNTYNPRWRDHPNFSYAQNSRPNQAYQPRPTLPCPQPHKTSLESIENVSAITLQSGTVVAPPIPKDEAIQKGEKIVDSGSQKKSDKVQTDPTPSPYDVPPPFPSRSVIYLEGLLENVLVEAPEVELKPLPDHLKYAFLGVFFQIPVAPKDQEKKTFTCPFDKTFDFDQEYRESFDVLKEKLASAHIVQPPNWDFPFEVMCDASDGSVGDILGHRIRKEPHDKKGCENLVANHLSRLPITTIDPPIREEFLEECLMMEQKSMPWFGTPRAIISDRDTTSTIGPPHLSSTTLAITGLTTPFHSIQCAFTHLLLLIIVRTRNQQHHDVTPPTILGVHSWLNALAFVEVPNNSEPQPTPRPVQAQGRTPNSPPMPYHSTFIPTASLHPGPSTIRHSTPSRSPSPSYQSMPTMASPSESRSSPMSNHLTTSNNTPKVNFNPIFVQPLLMDYIVYGFTGDLVTGFPPTAHMMMFLVYDINPSRPLLRFNASRRGHGRGRGCGRQ
ncbi:hypothetical protein F3Y22_tig00008235pilonHSYRG00005 [Hibiscus syriacus]|uniref:Uncharacterized protein n=1 Tax=Hibiscus syriacus TaxID=106335 RepID=A0A6A3CAC0_HIBSY|nr:hypothetical protein F3Y22_tig00008235pilonHSYRG00005 [Hibiscus syriacus]